MNYIQRTHGITIQTLILEYLQLIDNTITLNGFLGCEPDGVSIMSDLVIKDIRRNGGSISNEVCDLLKLTLEIITNMCMLI